MKRRLLGMLILLAGVLSIAAATQTDAPPLPERNPGRTGAPARQTPPPPGEVATIPWSVRAEIAELEAPWAVCRTGLEVVEPPEGDPFTPYRVCLERFGGLEHKVVAVPSVTRRDAHCRAELAAYQKEVTAILRSHGVLELFNKLNRLKAEAKTW